MLAEYERRQVEWWLLDREREQERLGARAWLYNRGLHGATSFVELYYFRGAE
jgi:hypothetical protein